MLCKILSLLSISICIKGYMYLDSKAASVNSGADIEVPMPFISKTLTNLIMKQRQVMTFLCMYRVRRGVHLAISVTRSL